VPNLSDGAWLRRQVESGRTTSQIAADVLRTPKAERYALRRPGLSLPTELRRADIDRDTMRADWRDGMSGPEIGRKHRVCATTVYFLMRGVKREQPVCRPVRLSKYPQLNDPSWLRVQLAVGCSVRAIARQIGCDDGIVSTWVRRHGIAPPPANMRRLDRIAALENPVERATAAAIVEQQALAEADGAAAIRTQALESSTSDAAPLDR
jgi:transposase-like protein